MNTSAAAPPSSRLQSVDAMRGAIMMLMAIDHIRDYIARSAMQFLPTDLTRTTPAIFLTRWITHFCAPVFMLTAGLGAFFWMSRGHHTKAQLSRFLLSRGLWLILLELTVLRWIMFSQFSFRGSIVILLVIWAIGLCFIILAGLIHLPLRWLAALSVAIIFLHNTLDHVSTQRFGGAAWIWAILHRPAAFSFAGITFRTSYVLLPWIGVMSAGYCLGAVFLWEPVRRKRTLLRLGIAATILFLLIRGINTYGDPFPWTHQPSRLFTVFSFLNTTKYPPSLDFLLMTLGPALIVMAAIDGFHFSSASPLIVFGRVPFFYYTAHLFLAHLIAVLLNFYRYGWTNFLFVRPPSMGGPAQLFPPDYGFPLWTVYALWFVVLIVLYPACRWFGHLKQRRKEWWLSYL
jgi:uncharacterized membrane protein